MAERFSFACSAVQTFRFAVIHGGKAKALHYTETETALAIDCDIR